MKHIILIGFKHVGKSAVGKNLSQELGLAYIDLDNKIEERYAKENNEKLTCRQIMLKHGELVFRDCESRALTEVLGEGEQRVVAVGGGAPLREENRNLMARHLVIHVSAPRNVVYERIMLNGRPAFFPDNEEPIISFLRLWEEREKIFQSLANCTVYNNGPLDQVVANIKAILTLNKILTV